MTPLIYAIYRDKPAIAHWLIDHRRQHDVNTRDRGYRTALLHACIRGPLSIVQALVASGADPTLRDGWAYCYGRTPLMRATIHGHSNIVAYLLRLPAVRATIDATDRQACTALSHASRPNLVQLLLDAGADPTIPSVYGSPLDEAIRLRRTATARLLRRAIAEPDRARTLHKARALLDAAIVINKAEKDARDHDNEQQRMHTRGQQMQAAVAAAPVYLQGRLQRYEAPLPKLELAPQRGRERVRATVAFVVGLEEGGVAYAGLSRELYEELLGYMMHAWADKGPEGEEQEEDEA